MPYPLRLPWRPRSMRLMVPDTAGSDGWTSGTSGSDAGSIEESTGGSSVSASHPPSGEPGPIRWAMWMGA